MTGLRLKCPGCGDAFEFGTDALRAKGEEAAATLTDTQLAENYREALKVMVRSAFPESMWRLPVIMVGCMRDDTAIAIGRSVLEKLLKPEV